MVTVRTSTREGQSCGTESFEGDGNPNLHKAAKSDDSVIQTQICDVLLSAPLDFHQWNLRVLLAVVNGEENKALDAHSLSALDQSYLSIPVYLQFHSHHRMS